MKKTYLITTEIDTVGIHKTTKSFKPKFLNVVIDELKYITQNELFEKNLDLSFTITAQEVTQ